MNQATKETQFPDGTQRVKLSSKTKALAGLVPSSWLFMFEMYLFYVYGYFCLHVHLRTTCVPGIHKGQKKTLDLLEEDLQMAVSCYVGFEKTYMGLLIEQPLSHLSSPCFLLSPFFFQSHRIWEGNAHTHDGSFPLC